jgi:hypothetical protein
MKFRIMKRFVNPLVRALLRSPAHGLLVVFAGRPEKRWWRSFRGGAPVAVVLRGRRLAGRGQAILDDPGAIAAAWGAYAAKFPRAVAARRAAEEAVLARISLVEGGDGKT